MEKMKSKMVKSIMMLLALASSNYSYASSFFIPPSSFYPQYTYLPGCSRHLLGSKE
jgi:hypothetical protein